MFCLRSTSLSTSGSIHTIVHTTMCIKTLQYLLNQLSLCRLIIGCTSSGPLLCCVIGVKFKAIELLLDNFDELALVEAASVNDDETPITCKRSRNRLRLSRPLRFLNLRSSLKYDKQEDRITSVDVCCKELIVFSRFSPRAVNRICGGGTFIFIELSQSGSIGGSFYCLKRGFQ